MRWRAALISMVMLYLGLQTPGVGHAALRLPPTQARMCGGQS